MARKSFRSVISIVNEIRQEYQDLPDNVYVMLSSVVESARDGYDSYGELLEKLRDYEAYYGHKISKEYEERTRGSNLEGR